MKYMLIFLPLFVFSESLDIKRLSKKIDLIKTNTKISPKLNYVVYDPFATAKPIIQKAKKTDKKNIYRKKRKHSINIQTILNDSVLIKHKWYNVGDKIYGYKIVSIKQNYIVLRKNNRKKIIHIKSKKDFIETKELIQ